MTAEGVTIEFVYDEEDADTEQQTSNETAADSDKTDESGKKLNNKNNDKQYQTGLKHFREVLEDWEAFILDDQSPA